MEQPSTQHHSPKPDLDKEKKAATRVTFIGMFLDAFLGIIKVIGGTLFNSQALLVDGIHSFTDVASDWVVLAVMRLSRKEPDADHPYGQQRIETIGTLLLGCFLIAEGSALAWANIFTISARVAYKVSGRLTVVAASG